MVASIFGAVDRCGIWVAVVVVFGAARNAERLWLEIIRRFDFGRDARRYGLVHGDERFGRSAGGEPLPIGGALVFGSADLRVDGVVGIILAGDKQKRRRSEIICSYVDNAGARFGDHVLGGVYSGVKRRTDL